MISNFTMRQTIPSGEPKTHICHRPEELCNQPHKEIMQGSLIFAARAQRQAAAACAGWARERVPDGTLEPTLLLNGLRGACA